MKAKAEMKAGRLELLGNVYDLENIGSVYISRYVYVCNRSLAPILRQSRCSLTYGVY